MANTTIALKKSSTPAATPAALANGELALNFADGKLYYKNVTGQIVAFSSTGNSFGIANVDNTLILSGTGNDVLGFRSGNNISLSANTTGKYITINGTGGSAAVPISSVAPSSPTANSLWWNSTLGRLFIYFNDGDSSQWVEATASGGIIANVSVTSASAYDQANAAYDQANGAYGNANSAANSANAYTVTVGASSNNYANASFTTIANGAAAFSKANNALANTAGVTFAGDLFFPLGANVTIGSTTPTAPLSISKSGIVSLTLSGALIDADGTANSYLQTSIRNANTGQLASSDYTATTDDGTDTTNYIDLGINNSGFSSPTWTINGARDGYLYVQDTNLSIGSANTGSPTKFINFFLGGSAIVDEVMRLQDSAGGANVGIGITNPAYKLDVNGTVNAAAVLVNGAQITGGGTTLGAVVAAAIGFNLP